MSVASFEPVLAVLLIPIGSAALLAVLPGYRVTARLNVLASLATFLSALSLFIIERPQIQALVGGLRRALDVAQGEEVGSRLRT